MNAVPMKLSPNKTDIAAHLHALFSPAFVHLFPDAWIEIAYGHPPVAISTKPKIIPYSS